MELKIEKQIDKEKRDREKKEKEKNQNQINDPLKS